MYDVYDSGRPRQSERESTLILHAHLSSRTQRFEVGPDFVSMLEWFHLQVGLRCVQFISETRLLMNDRRVVTSSLTG